MPRRKWKLISHPSNTNPFPGSFLNYHATAQVHAVSMTSSLSFVKIKAEFDTELQVCGLELAMVLLMWHNSCLCHVAIALATVFTSAGDNWHKPVLYCRHCSQAAADLHTAFVHIYEEALLRLSQLHSTPTRPAYPVPSQGYTPAIGQVSMGVTSQQMQQPHRDAFSDAMGHASSGFASGGRTSGGQAPSRKPSRESLHTLTSAHQHLQPTSSGCSDDVILTDHEASMISRCGAMHHLPAQWAQSYVMNMGLHDQARAAAFAPSGTRSYQDPAMLWRSR